MISRGLRRNLDRHGRYRAAAADAHAGERASPAVPAKLATDLALREVVERDLEKECSPEQITGRLLVGFLDAPVRCRCHPRPATSRPTVRSGGALRRDVAVCPPAGRALRRPSREPGVEEQRNSHWR